MSGVDEEAVAVVRAPGMLRPLSLPVGEDRRHLVGPPDLRKRSVCFMKLSR